MTEETVGLTATQLEVRRKGIGASEIAAVLGADPRATPFDVWVRKTQRNVRAEEDSTATFGQLVEPVIAKLFTLETGRQVVYAGGQSLELLNTIALATPDYYVTAEKPSNSLQLDRASTDLLECKSRDYRTFSRFGSSGTDEVPIEIGMQAQWQLLVTGLAVCHVAVLVDRKLHIFTVQADREAQGVMLERATDWWDKHVKGNVQPPLQGVSVEPYLRKKFALVDVDVRKADFDEALLLQDYAVARLTKKRAEEAEQSVKFRVLEHIGHAKGIASDEYRALWSQVKGRKSIDWEAIAQEYRGMLGLYTAGSDMARPDVLTRADLDGVVEKNTKVGEPSRRLTFKDLTGGTYGDD